MGSSLCANGKKQRIRTSALTLSNYSNCKFYLVSASEEYILSYIFKDLSLRNSSLVLLDKINVLEYIGIDVVYT